MKNRCLKITMHCNVEKFMHKCYQYAIFKKRQQRGESVRNNEKQQTAYEISHRALKFLRFLHVANTHIRTNTDTDGCTYAYVRTHMRAHVSYIGVGCIDPEKMSGTFMAFCNKIDH